MRSGDHILVIKIKTSFFVKESNRRFNVAYESDCVCPPFPSAPPPHADAPPPSPKCPAFHHRRPFSGTHPHPRTQSPPSRGLERQPPVIRGTGGTVGPGNGVCAENPGYLGRCPVNQQEEPRESPTSLLSML